MNTKCFFAFIILMPAILYSQVYENNYYPSIYLGGRPIAEQKMSGIGNLGFGEYGSIYNPHFIPIPNSLSLSAGVFINVSGNVHTQDWDEYKNIYRALPSIGIKFRNEDFLFQINYSHTLYSNLVSNGGSWTFPLFSQSSPYQRYNLISVAPNFILDNYRLQLSISKRIENELSFSLAALFNGTNETIDFNNNYGERKFYVSLLRYPQFIVSLNYAAEPLNAYVLFKNQRPNIRTSSDFLFNGQSMSNADYPIVSFPGLIGYGLQINVMKDLQLSIEVAHSFVVADTAWTNVLGSKYKAHNDLWNNEIIIGSTYSLLSNCKLGILYDHYLKYERTNLTNVMGIPNIQKPWYIVFSIVYDYHNLSMSLHYQYSFVRETGLDYFNSSYSIDNYNSLLDFMISVYLF